MTFHNKRKTGFVCTICQTMITGNWSLLRGLLRVRLCLETVAVVERWFLVEVGL